MKTLLLLRHAKSSWGDSSAPDFERPLAARGIADAPRIGHALQQRGPLPDLIMSSPALRATQTIEAVVKAAGLPVSPQFDQNIYGASSAELLKIVRRLPDTSSRVMLVGHNPTFSELVSRLTDTSQDMPTAALACVEFQIDRWADVEDGGGKLAWIITPKTLGGKATD
jgi:phosphohistidine phosphatase